MRRPRFYCPSLVEGVNALEGDEAHHAAAVLRVRAGAEVLLFDGAGRESVARIVRVERRRVDVQAGPIERRPFDLAHRLTLAPAMSRGHRQGYMIEKCTELGAAGIWPLITSRSVARPEADAGDKWFRRAVEAAKQSGRAYVPAIAAPQSLEAAVARIGEFDAAAMTDVVAAGIPFGRFLSARPDGASVLAFVGPEGGWTEPEREQLCSAGATPTTLAPTVLRVETAAVAVCAAVAMHSVRLLTIAGAANE